MNRNDREVFFARLAALEPEPKTELNWSTPFELLVAVLLSAQSTDVGVNKVTRVLFAHANTPQAIADLGLETLSEYLRTLGLYRNKAKHLIETCEILLRDHGGRVPNDRASLEALPGVGRKTANVVLNTAFGEPTIAVDTHIFRVSNRTGLAKGTTPLAVESQLLRRVPSQWRQHAHHWLILHGRYVCKARKPLCGECPVDDLCAWRKRELRREVRAENSGP